MVIGTDFDNTLAAYDGVLHALASARNWLPPGTPENKRAIRDALRLQPDGEDKWQQLQARIYGPDMKEAKLFDGVREFAARCRAYGAPLYVVSHKTRYPARANCAGDLHEAAWSWMEEHRFFAGYGLGLARDQVFFEPTRAGKLSRIERLGCTHFVDDLEETFSEPEFPGGVERILFDPWGAGCANPVVRPLSGWKSIGDFLFGEAG